MACRALTSALPWPVGPIPPPMKPLPQSVGHLLSPVEPLSWPVGISVEPCETITLPVGLLPQLVGDSQTDSTGWWSVPHSA